jgi:hypothetical protein
MIDEKAYKLLAAIRAGSLATFTHLKGTIPNPKTLTSKLRMPESIGLLPAREAAIL